MKTALVLALALTCPLALSAQRGAGASREKPAVDVVQTVGCGEKKTGSPDTWWLVRAAEPRVSPPGLFNSNQVEAARKAALGTLTFQLVGVADFLTPEELLASAQRKAFTTTENVNATGQLRPGHKVLIKGMLINAGDQKRINLLSVVGLADSCS